MIEWQNESSLFVIRIQGKQWYWVYKYNSDTNYRLQNVYLNVGNNNWYKTSNQWNLSFNSKNSTLFYIHEYEFKKVHKMILENKSKSSKDLQTLAFTNQFAYFNTNISKKYQNNTLDNLFNKIYFTNLNFNTLDSNSNIFNWFQLTNTISNKNFNNIRLNINYSILSNLNESNKLNNLNLLDSFTKNNSTNYENDILEDVEETSENLRAKVNKFPVKLIKGVLNKHNVEILNSNDFLTKNILFSYRLNNDNIVEKIAQVEQFWGFRQKKYKKLRSFVFSQNSRFHNRSYQPIARFVNNENFNKYNIYTGIKNNKTKDELISVTLGRRLLRTKRTLVLPAHINITLIASSYDVVHSWFVPGLGLKIDCVPGRSNHLTIYIDNIGFYYGQCAEICGRYHHHMPIRVCALNYEQFLLWWQTKGLPRMYRSENFLKRKSILLQKFKV